MYPYYSTDWTVRWLRTGFPRNRGTLNLAPVFRFELCDMESNTARRSSDRTAIVSGCFYPTDISHSNIRRASKASSFGGSQIIADIDTDIHINRQTSMYRSSFSWITFSRNFLIVNNMANGRKQQYTTVPYRTISYHTPYHIILYDQPYYRNSFYLRYS